MSADVNIETVFSMKDVSKQLVRKIMRGITPPINHKWHIDSEKSRDTDSYYVDVSMVEPGSRPIYGNHLSEGEIIARTATMTEIQRRIIEMLTGMGFVNLIPDVPNDDYVSVWFDFPTEETPTLSDQD